MKILQPLLVVLVSLVLNTSLHATIIIPPADFETMLDEAQILVYGEVLSHATEDGYSNNFRIIQSFKGQLSAQETIILKEYSSREGDLFSLVNGDVNYEIGEKYLIFLFQDGYGHYKAEMLALSVYKEGMRDGERILAHTNNVLDLCFTDSINSELTGGFLSKPLIKSIKSRIDTGSRWKASDAGFLESDMAPETKISEDHSHHDHKSGPCPNNAPAHCTTLFGSPSNLDGNCNFNIVPDGMGNNILVPLSPAKFSSPNFTVKVSSGASSDPSLANEFVNLTAAVNELNAFTGISVVEASPVIQTCSTAGCSAASSVAFGCNPFPYSNDIWVMFDDPCNEINWTSTCNGTVGIGGSFVTSSCHTDACGDQWLNSIIPYFVMNDNAGCVGDFGYTAVLIHEMLHSISLGHIAGSCSALMNPFLCGNTSAPDFGVTNLDDDCVDWMYNIGVAPVCSISNTMISSGPFCNGANIDFGIQFDVTNGSGTYDLYIGGSFFASVSGAANGTVTSNFTNVTVTSGITNFYVEDQFDANCNDSVTGVVPNCATGGPCDNGTVNVSTVTATTYFENDVLNSTAIINVSPVTFEAEDEINLMGPFEVKATSNFLAHIVPCN